MIPILQWAREILPSHPRIPFYLGSLLMARRRTQEALRLWKQAEKLGEGHYLLYARLGYFERFVGKHNGRRIRYFRQAASRNRDDLYVRHELALALVEAGREKEALKFLESELEAVLTSPLLTYDLLNVYLDLEWFDKFDALCRKVDFSINWQIPGPHLLWVKRHIKEALQQKRHGNLESALALLRNLEALPENLGEVPENSSYTSANVGLYDADNDPRRLYHLGCIYEKMGRMSEAHQCWEKAAAIRNYTGAERGYLIMVWSQRYFQALSLLKLGRVGEANAYFDAMELVAKHTDLPLAAREALMKLVERGRFAPEDAKDPLDEVSVAVETSAEV